MTPPVPAAPEGDPAAPTASDQHIARLTARADLIVEELDVVVQQMSELLRKKFQS